MPNTQSREFWNHKRPQASIEWMSAPSAQRIVVLAAHMGDEVLGCGGILRKCALEGKDVAVIYLTDGGYQDLDPNTNQDRAGREVPLMRLRQERARHACSVLGINETFFLDAQSGRVRSTPEIRNNLLTLLLRLKPEAVFYPFFLGSDIDHRDAARVLVEATHATALSFDCYGYAIGTALYSNCAVDITDVIDTKRAALSISRSQHTKTKYVRATPEFSASSALKDNGEGHVEAFLRLPLRSLRTFHWNRFIIQRRLEGRLSESLERTVERRHNEDEVTSGRRTPIRRHLQNLYVLYAKLFNPVIVPIENKLLDLYAQVFPQRLLAQLNRCIGNGLGYFEAQQHFEIAVFVAFMRFVNVSYEPRLIMAERRIVEDVRAPEDPHFRLFDRNYRPGGALLPKAQWFEDNIMGQCFYADRLELTEEFLEELVCLDDNGGVGTTHILVGCMLLKEFSDIEPKLIDPILDATIEPIIRAMQIGRIEDIYSERIALLQWAGYERFIEPAHIVRIILGQLKDGGWYWRRPAIFARSEQHPSCLALAALIRYRETMLKQIGEIPGIQRKMTSCHGRESERLDGSH